MALRPPPERLTRSYHRQLLRSQRATTAAALVLFDSINSPSIEDQAEFANSVTPLLLASQTRVVGMVDAYYSAAAGLATGTSTEPIGLDPAELIGAKARQGVALETVYRRPLWEWERRQEALEREALQQLGRGRGAGQAMRFVSPTRREQVRLYARSRIAKDIVTDMQLVQRDAAWTRAQIDPRLPRWRRVLSGSDSCPLCITASSNTYAKIRRIQLHPGCDCGIEPAGDSGVMAMPNLSELPDVYRKLNSEVRRGTGISKAVDETGPVTLYRDQLNVTLADDAPPIEVVEHGELGPTLWVRGHDFSDN